MPSLARTLRLALLPLGLAAAALSAAAQAFPAKPVNMVVPFAPGGAADVLARVLAQGTQLGQPILVDNKPGAGGSIAATLVARAPADGHTLLFVTAGHAGTKALYPQVGYDPVADFAPVLGLAAAPVVIAVNANSPYRTIQDFVQAARKNPGKLNCAGGGGGATVTNLAFELLKSQLKLQITAVPYKGSAPAITALLAGEIDCDSDAIATLLPQIQSGKLRALAVTTRKRSGQLPGVPTIAETVLPGMDASAWYGVVAPKGTPPAVVERLHREFAATAHSALMKERLAALGAEPMDLAPTEFGHFLASETQRWGGLIRQLGLTGQ